MTAISSRLAVVLAASLGLLACSGAGTTAADNFKPVPVTPVLGDVTLGSPGAKITILEYAALSCSHCRDFWKQDFPRLKTNYIDTGKVKYIYRDWPLEPGDGFGVLLASVARCKGAADYYAIIDDFFTSQSDILEAAQKGAAGPLIAALADRHGLSHDQTRTCIDYAPELKASILKSKEEGATRKVHSTPTVFLNDVIVEIHDYEHLSAAIDQKLAELNGAAPAAPTTPAAPVSAPAH